MELLGQYQIGAVQSNVHATEQDGGKLVITKKQDVTMSREFASAMGNDEEVWKKGVKNSWAMVGHIPDIAIVELRKLGVDVFTAPLKDIRAGLRKLGQERYIWKS